MEIVLSLSLSFLALLPYHMNNDSVSANNVLACMRVNPFCPLKPGSRHARKAFSDVDRNHAFSCFSRTNFEADTFFSGHDNQETEGFIS